MDKSLIRFLSKFIPPPTFDALRTSIEKSLYEPNITLHPYGFYILKIDDFNSDYYFRIHIWLKGERNKQLPDWRPHQHNTDIYSHILMGNVTNITWKWQECASLSDAENRIYTVEYKDNISKLIRTDDIGNIIFDSKSTYLKNMDYFVSKDIFHFTDVLQDDESMTLALFSKQTKGASKVVGIKDGEETYHFNRGEIDKKTLIDIQRFVENYLLL